MRTKLYVVVLLLVAVPSALVGFFWPVIGIAKCSGAGYRPDNYIAYCETKQYGDYEDAAFYFALEPEAVRHAREAEILVLGNSRALVAFSTQALRDFTAQHSWRIYLMAFGFGDGWPVAEGIMRRQQIRPKAVIINVDPFFADFQSGLAKELLGPGDKSGTYLHHLIKRVAQAAHRATCGANVWPELTCGSRKTIYRSITDGMWDVTYYREDTIYPVKIDAQRQLDIMPELIENAERFFKSTGIDPKCAILTTVPSDSATPLVVAKLAEHFGAPLIAAEIADLQTFDKSHMMPESAERWSAQVLAAAEPVLRRCL